MSPAATPSIFLSYAREDTAAARRLAEALRAAGLEVWFDENELRGGDSWDAKIRRQIRECTLFLPVISAQTQARHEGYFRREWKLAVERMGDMAAGIAFLVPVVVDDTREAEALVPEEFMRVQWTRLPGALPTPQFVEQVKRLLTAPRVPSGRSAASAPSPALPAPSPSAPRKSFPALGALMLGVGVAAVAIGFFLLSRRESPASPPPGVPAASAPAPEKSAAAVPAPGADAKSIAVLPFTSMSADKENEFFADGMHDDLITALAKVRDLKVISRTSVLAYRDTAARNLRRIAADLGVAAVLEGSVQRAGNRVRINLQLIDARTDAHLWAETYNRELNDIFAIQAELVQQVAGVLKAKLTAGEQDLLARRPTENPQAYELYLRARILDQSLQIFSSRSDYERVASLYEQAAEIDPSFTLALVQASISHGTMFWFAALDPTPERRRRSLAALERARALTPGSPEVRMAEGSFAYTCNNDWLAALREYRAAESGLPNDSQLQYRMALAHRRLGEIPEALARLERCVALNPNDSRSITTLIETLLALRRYAAVIARFEQYRGLLAGDYNATRFQLIARLELGGDPAAIMKEIAALPPRYGDPHGLDSAYTYALHSGDLAQAERILQDPRWQIVLGLGGTVNEPVALHRAQLAWLLGRPDEARRQADEAIAYYRAGSWSLRQQPVVQMGIARAEAFAGRADAAIREGRAALTAQQQLDYFNLPYFRHWLGTVFLVAGRPAEAREELRQLMAGFSTLSASEIRHDPIWSRLQDDPRFEEILKSVPRL